MKSQKKKRRIRQNAWGNWYGYEGTKRVKAFTNPIPGYGAEEIAREWLEEKSGNFEPLARAWNKACDEADAAE